MGSDVLPLPWSLRDDKISSYLSLYERGWGDGGGWVGVCFKNDQILRFSLWPSPFTPVFLYLRVDHLHVYDYASVFIMVFD